MKIFPFFPAPIDTFFTAGGCIKQSGVPFYGKSKKIKPVKKRRKKRNKKGFISPYHQRGYA